MSQSGEKGKVLEGTVERVVFRNPENGWTVMRLTVEGAAPLRTVVGSFQALNPGERVRFTGKWVQDARHGRQFRAETCLPLAPATLKGIEKFLGSGLIPGIGQVMAHRMVSRFGLDTLEVIENAPERLAEVEGIGGVRAKSISAAMREKREVKDVMVFLESAGISPGFAHRIYKRYGKRSIIVVSENPYRLATEVHGIGFLSADRIAAHLGVAPDSPHRAEAGLLYALEECAAEGHVFVPGEELLPRGEALLQIDVRALSEALDRLLLMGGVRVLGKGPSASVYLPRLYEAEKSAGEHLRRLLSTRVPRLPIDPGRAIQMAEKLSGIALAAEQRRAFELLGRSGVLVLTGGPGTGKTTLLKGIVACLSEQKLSIAMAAPTGRAARRMSESTGRDARTIHRMLEFNPRKNRFDRRRSRPLEQQVVIVDEVSMVDIELFAALLGAVPDGTRLILVGDPDQLPSVGPGTVLSDLLTIGARPGTDLGVVRLTEIFRQARSSLIVTGAHEILKGRPPVTGEKGAEADLFMIEREDPEECLKVILDMVGTRIPSRFHLDPISDIQVLTPMHKGILGASNLNVVLQELLNPSSEGVEHRDQRYAVGDKVMQIRNNYDLDVYNGDIGRVTVVGQTREWLEIDYGDRVVRYPVSELDQTTLAYACSIHKSQGSEYPAVVIPLHTQHFVMLQRNLLYTGITRGKKLVVIVGSKRALRIAVKNDGIVHRCSNLVDQVLSG